MSPTRTARATTGPVGLVLVLMVLTLLLGAPAASAHDVVESSDPAEGAALVTAPARVSITLSEAPQGPNTLTVVGPDGRRYEQGAATTAGDVVSVGVSPLGPAGAYEIGYRIVSSDGHPVSGSIPFTLTAPGPAAAPAAGPAVAAPSAPGPGSPDAAAGQPRPSPAAGQTAPAPGGDQGGVPAWPFVVLAVVVVAGAVALALRRRAS